MNNAENLLIAEASHPSNAEQPTELNRFKIAGEVIRELSEQLQNAGVDVDTILKVIEIFT